MRGARHALIKFYIVNTQVWRNLHVSYKPCVDMAKMPMRACSRIDILRHGYIGRQPVTEQAKLARGKACPNQILYS